jgi:hypothetical protein
MRSKHFTVHDSVVWIVVRAFNSAIAVTAAPFLDKLLAEMRFPRMR